MKNTSQADLDRIIPGTEALCSVRVRGHLYVAPAVGGLERPSVLQAFLRPEGVHLTQWVTHENEKHLTDGRCTVLSPEAARRFGRMLILAAEEHGSETYREELRALNRLGRYRPNGRLVVAGEEASR